MGEQSHKQSYYYASGKRMPLTRAKDYLAVEEKSLASVKLSADVKKKVLQTAQPLRHGLSLIRRETLPTNVYNKLATEGVALPVFQYGSTFIIALPEVRIEETRASQSADVEAWLKKNDQKTEVLSKRRGQFVLRPKSGSGEEALDLANRLHEEVGPELAQTRFLRIVPKTMAMKG